MTDTNADTAPSMFATAVDAAAKALPPDTPTATVEQVALAVLRVALPLHTTQHANAWRAAAERATHFELEALKLAEELAAVRAERLKSAEKYLLLALDRRDCGTPPPRATEVLLAAARRLGALLDDGIEQAGVQELLDLLDLLTDSEPLGEAP